jgi:hypothetical protein
LRAGPGAFPSAANPECCKSCRSNSVALEGHDLFTLLARRCCLSPLMKSVGGTLGALSKLSLCPQAEATLLLAITHMCQGQSYQRKRAFYLDTKRFIRPSSENFGNIDRAILPRCNCPFHPALRLAHCVVHQEFFKWKSQRKSARAASASRCRRVGAAKRACLQTEFVRTPFSCVSTIFVNLFRKYVAIQPSILFS